MWIIAQAERDVVEAMTQCKKPDMGGLQQLITPVGEAIQAADKLTQVCPVRAVGSRAQHHGSALQRNCSNNPVSILRDSRMPVVANPGSTFANFGGGAQSVWHVCTSEKRRWRLNGRLSPPESEECCRQIAKVLAFPCRGSVQTPSITARQWPRRSLL